MLKLLMGSIHLLVIQGKKKRKEKRKKKRKWNRKGGVHRIRGTGTEYVRRIRSEVVVKTINF